MAKRTLTEEEKAAIRKELRPKYPGETIVVDDETDDDGNPRVGTIKVDVVEMPKGWDPRKDGFPKT